MASITRRDLARALARARAKAGTPETPSGVSRAARVGDAIALYAAPVEERGVEGQAALGGGSVTDDLLSGSDDLVDRGAVERELGPLKPGPYDLLINFAIDDSDAGRSWRRTERRTVWISGIDSPAERASKAARQMQTVTRDIVKEASKFRVRMVGALLIPSDDSVTVELGVMDVQEPPAITTGGEIGRRPRRSRSESARKGWETRRARAAAREAARIEAQREAEREAARRSAAARKAAATRKRNAETAKRRAAAVKGWATRRAKAKRAKGRKRGR